VSWSCDDCTHMVHCELEVSWSCDDCTHMVHRELEVSWSCDRLYTHGAP